MYDKLQIVSDNFVDLGTIPLSWNAHSLKKNIKIPKNWLQIKMRFR